jgi:hypothetical protein
VTHVATILLVDDERRVLDGLAAVPCATAPRSPRRRVERRPARSRISVPHRDRRRLQDRASTRATHRSPRRFKVAWGRTSLHPELRRRRRKRLRVALGPAILVPVFGCASSTHGWHILFFSLTACQAAKISDVTNSRDEGATSAATRNGATSPDYSLDKRARVWRWRHVRALELALRWR